MGSAMVLQGGLVKHLALRGSGSSDRITLVTSYRAKAVGLYDSSFLTNVRPYTDLCVLYPQWINYRLQVIAKNSAAMYKRHLVEDVPRAEMVAFLNAQRQYARCTERQIVPKDFVRAQVSRHGIPVFYDVINMFVSGPLFRNAPETCPRCGAAEKVDKRHLAVCPMAREWMPESLVWRDLEETRSGAFLKASRPDLEQVIHAFRKEDREWGMADELATQGLTEYLLDFLDFFGIMPEVK
jgi:hypothetical protein